MTLITTPNSAEMCRIAEHCSGVATRQELDDLTRPRGILAYIINFFTDGSVRRENAKPYEAFAQAMKTALIQEGSSDVHPYTPPESLVVDCFGYTIIFTQPGAIHNAAGPVTVEVSKDSETVVAELDKDKFCRISTALMLRHKGRLRSTSAVLTDNNGMNLRGANFFKTNLRGLDLSEADLSYANLREADLRESGLRGACLSRAAFFGAKLAGANLNNADLSWHQRGKSDDGFTDLRDVNLSGANLSGADLSGANLSRANLSGADLSGANLNNSWLDKANLSGANLSEACLNGSLLTDVNLSKANLSGIRHSWVNLSSAALRGANLSGANLSKLNFYRINLFDAQLRGYSLRGANLMDANLSGVSLRMMDLSGANLRGTNLSGADLRGTKLNGADLSDILQKGTLLKLPRWNSTTLDTHLNHIYNRASGSLLTMMDSIDDRHADVKLRMARELMRSLQKTWANTSAVARPLMDILSKPPYTDEADIAAWLDTVCETYLARCNGRVLPVNAGVFNQSVDLFTRRPALMLSHNGAFIQIIAQGMAASSTPAMKQKAAGLYETYLQQEPVKPYCSLEDFGDGEGKPDWADKHTANFILLSAQPATVSAMLLSQASLEGMLRPQVDTAWNNVYLYKDEVNLSPTESPALDDLFARAFPLFNGPYQHMQNSAKFLLLLKALNLGSLETAFVSATRVKNSAGKLVNAAGQKTLKVIFAPKLTYSPESGRYGLNAAHYEELVSAYGLTSAGAADKGKTLLCLAALFTKYSSSAVFGTETESPEALRQYAYALMEKAHGLDESLVDKGTLANWTNRLLGLKGAFTCSAELSNLMVEHIRSRFPAVLSGIMPPAWG